MRRYTNSDQSRPFCHGADTYLMLHALMKTLTRAGPKNVVLLSAMFGNLQMETSTIPILYHIANNRYEVRWMDT